MIDVAERETTIPNEREEMNNTLRCQSCGMPLGEGFFGTASNGTYTEEYCKLCFRDGNFLEPDLTLSEMMNRSITHMTQQLAMPVVQATTLAEQTIPQLKRWKS